MDVGFCPLVVERGEPVIIPVTLSDPTYSDNAAAKNGGGRFYAGIPLAADGQGVFGTLCVLNTVPRPAGLTQLQMDALTTLSMQVVS